MSFFNAINYISVEIHDQAYFSFLVFDGKRFLLSIHTQLRPKFLQQEGKLSGFIHAPFFVSLRV